MRDDLCLFISRVNGEQLLRGVRGLDFSLLCRDRYLVEEGGSRYDIATLDRL